MKKAIIKKAACSAFIFAMVAGSAVAAPKAKADMEKNQERPKIEKPAKPDCENKGRPEDCTKNGCGWGAIQFDENNLPKAAGDIYAEDGMLKIKTTDGKVFVLRPDFKREPGKEVDIKDDKKTPGRKGYMKEAKKNKGKEKGKTVEKKQKKQSN